MTVTKEQISEFLNNTDFNQHDGATEGFDEELFHSGIVAEEEEYLKHTARSINYIHRVAGSDIYFSIYGIADNNCGLDLDGWTFVEPVEEVKVFYRVVK
jgi:hypothetical protein